MLIRHLVNKFENKVLRSRAALWLPGQDLMVPRNQNILAVLNDGVRKPRLASMGSNIVTHSGDIWYAESAASETPTQDFTTNFLSSVNWDSPEPTKFTTTDKLASVITGADSTAEATYPKTADADADNTGSGADVVTWLFSYAKVDFNDTDIDAGCISIAGARFGDPGASPQDEVLTAYDLLTFAKTADDTLKLFVNHTMNGV